jgi:hypothetical protein
MAKDNHTILHPAGSPTPSVEAQQVILLLENTLREAKATGAYTTCCVIMVTNKGFGSAAAGSQYPELNLALDGAKKNIVDALADPRARSASSIIKPGR